MRKLLALLALVAVCIMMLASCDVLLGNKEEECEHTFSEKWSTNANQHWHAATCEHGEMRDQLADHTDEDEDGLCDVCAHQIGHEHTFASTWTTDDDKHWKEAICSHSDAKGYEALHSDNNTDGICDVCAGHVHILDGAGFCVGCDKEVKPVDETDFASVVAATTARAFKIKSGKVEYMVITRSVTEAQGDEPYSESMAWDVVDYIFGTNGVYRKITEDEFDGNGLTGNTAITEQWVALFTEENGVGIQAVSSVNPDTLESVYVDAMPAAFGSGDLLGYFFAVPTLADAYGADVFLYNLHAMATAVGTDETVDSTIFPSDLVVTTDPENNKITFSYNVYIVNATHMSDDSWVYQVNYFEVDGAFTYSDDYALTSLEVTVDTYTNEPGRGDSQSYEADIDLTYDPDTGVMTLLPTAVPHTYSFKVTQEEGEREEIALMSMDYFMPESFDVYASANGETPITSLTTKVGKKDAGIFLIGEGGFIDFLYSQMTVTITDVDGNPIAGGLQASRTGAEIQLYANKEGVYVVTVSAIDITRSVTVTVEENLIKTDYSFEITAVDNNSWANTFTFKPGKAGVYVIYLPGNVGLSLVDPFQEEGTPIYDPQQNTTSDLEPYAYRGTTDLDGDGKADGIIIRTDDATVTFHFYSYEKNVTYTVYYDIVEI